MWNVGSPQWRREVESKSTLQLYRHKIGIGDEGIYSNRYGSVLLFQCRTNTLRVGWRQRFVGGEVECPICGAGEDTLAHFVTECEALDGVRRRFAVGRGDPLEEVLLFGGRTGEEVERTTKMLEEMYGARRKKLEEREDRPAQQ